MKVGARVKPTKANMTQQSTHLQTSEKSSTTVTAAALISTDSYLRLRATSKYREGGGRGGGGSVKSKQVTGTANHLALVQTQHRADIYLFHTSLDF